jgi:hypothetical protein
MPGVEDLMVFKTGNKGHDDALVLAEQTRQAANVPGATAAQLKAADVAYARAARTSCVANNGSSGVEQFTVMLRELGTGGG